MTQQEDQDLATAPIGAGEPHTPAPPDVTPAEAIYGFAGWLTTRGQSVTLGATHDAAVAADLVEAFRKSQGWEPPREAYADLLKTYPDDDDDQAHFDRQADGAYDDHQAALRAEDQAHALRVAAACEIVMAEGADVWAFTGFANPDGQDGISDSRIFFTGIDDDSQLHFAINATRVGQQVEVTTHAPPEQCPISWCERATANKALVAEIVSASDAAAARDALMRATGEAPRT